MVTKSDADWLREYTKLRRDLFPDEQCNGNRRRSKTAYHDETDGRVQCGGGYRRFLVAGSASK